MTTLVENNAGAAAANTAAMQAAFFAGEELVVDPGKYYFAGTSYTPSTMGCGRLVTKGGDLYSVGGHPTLTGNGIVRFIQTVSGSPILGISGVGFQCPNPIEFVGLGVGPAIEVYGQSSIASGHHDLNKITFHYWEYAIDVLAGYRNPSTGAFTADEAHADNSRAYKCKTFEVGTFFRCKNQQAMNWVLDTCFVQGLARNGLLNPYTQRFADIERGGCLTIRNPIIEHPRTTMIRVKDFSPNNCWFKIENLYLDRFDPNVVSQFWITILEHQGNDIGAWTLDVTGWVSSYLSNFDKSKLFAVPSTLPRKNWRVRLDGLPLF